VIRAVGVGAGVGRRGLQVGLNVSLTARGGRHIMYGKRDGRWKLPHCEL
jgi:hypothetical protein